MRFSEAFGRYVCTGDTITCSAGPWTATATIYHDDDATAPWDRAEGHGPVSEWTTREKRPGERVLHSDRASKRYYDFAEAVQIAKRDGWRAHKDDANGTPGEIAARAAESDFNTLRAWCRDEWSYCGVAVTIERAGIRLTGKYDHALWGVEYNYPESDNSYLLEIANELLPDALNAAKAKVKELATT